MKIWFLDIEVYNIYDPLRNEKNTCDYLTTYATKLMYRFFGTFLKDAIGEFDKLDCPKVSFTCIHTDLNWVFSYFK